MKICIIIPTYNELTNVGLLLPVIAQLNIPKLTILVVDDNSPDGTGQAAESLKSQISKLEVIHRRHKAGLGPAYVAGFKYALKIGAEVICQMDADFSHDPKDLPNFLTAIREADLV